MKHLQIFLILVVAAIMFSCSSSQETASENADEQEIYVFDDITEAEIEEPDTVQAPPPAPVVESSLKYIVQVGAFTTEERAQSFVEEKKNSTVYPLNISFSSAVNLFVVQLPPFDNRTEAEKVRDELWDTKKFEDAFILTVK